MAKAICVRCHKDYDQVPNPTLGDVRCKKCDKIFYKECDIKDQQNRISFWESKINEANYHIKNRKKDIEKLQSQLEELKLK